MTKRDILDTYMGLKDDGLSHQEIEAAFLDPENTGGDPIDINLELKQLRSLDPEKMMEMTDDAFTESDIDVSRKIWDVSQQALQGMTFGFADEIEARLRSLAKDTDYEDEIEDVRAEIEAFRKENPGMAFTAEMAGAFLIPGFATTKLIQMAPKLGQFDKGQKLFNAMKRAIVGAGAGTIEGGLYGAGVAEEGERIEGAKEGAFWGSIMGAVLGPTLGWFTDAIAGKLSSKVGQKGDEMVDVDGNVVIEPAKPSATKEAKDLMIRAAQIDDVGGLKKLQGTLDEYIKSMPEVLKKMTFAQLYPEGGFGQGLAELIAKTPGRGMAASRKIYDKMSEELPGRARDLIKKAFGPRVANVDAFKDFLWARATKKARPFYNKAEEELVDVPDLIAHVKRLMGPDKNPDTVGKIVREVLATTRLDLPRKMAKKGIDAPNWGKSGPYNNSPIFHWDLFKQELDTVIKRASKDKSMSGGNLDDLKGLYSDITKTVGDLNPDYKKATGIHVSKHKYIKAFEDGLSAHKDKSITPEFMKSELQKLSGSSDEMMYRMGYAFGMYQKVLTKSSKTGRDPKASLGLFAEDQTDKIRALFKTEKIADQFLEKIHVLSQASASANKFRYGSPTYPLTAMGEMVEGMDQPGLIKQTIDAVKDWGGSKKGFDDMLDSPVQKRLDASSAMMTKQGPEDIQKVIDGLKARELEKLRRESGTMGAGYPAGVTGAMAPLYAGEDRQWTPGYDEEEKRIRRGILSGPMDLPNKMYGWGSSLLN
jgi:hypothetical protein